MLEIRVILRQDKQNYYLSSSILLPSQLAVFPLLSTVLSVIPPSHSSMELGPSRLILILSITSLSSLLIELSPPDADDKT